MTKNTRTYTWENPTTLLEEAKKQSGYDLLVGVLNGSLPQAPALETIHSTLIAVEKGQAVFELKASAFLYNLIGTIHGGMISTVLDTAIGCSLLTTLAAGESFTSLDLKVNFLKKITTDSPLLHTETTIIHQGRTTAYLESKLVDATGVIYAHAVSTCLIFR